MTLFNNCSGECCICAIGDGCLAGHGDDDFYPASREQIIERLDKGEYKEYTNVMKNHLKNRFGYDYDDEKEWLKKIDRYTALEVLKEFARDMYPSNDIFGTKTLVITRRKFEAIRAKYLDRK